MARPLILLDIDGTLSPLGGPRPPGYEEIEAGYVMYVNRDHAARLVALAGSADLVWATTWEDTANLLLGPALGFARLPVIHFDAGTSAGGDGVKLAAVRAFVGDRPCVWIDDQVDDRISAWATTRNRVTPTLVLKTSKTIGITDRDLRRVETFVRAQVLRETPPAAGIDA